MKSNQPEAVEIPIVIDIPKVIQTAQDAEAGFADFSAILAGSKVKERPTEVRTFTFNRDGVSKSYKFEIYTDGRDDAELWSRLSAGMMHGYAQEGAARLTGQIYKGEEVLLPLPDGAKKIVVKDPAYLGNVKVLSLVLKRPGWGWTELLIMGHELGQQFLNVCDWAATANGVTEDYLRKMDELEKNAASRLASGV